jgi:hypothetical protein
VAAGRKRQDGADRAALQEGSLFPLSARMEVVTLSSFAANRPVRRHKWLGAIKSAAGVAAPHEHKV